MKNKQRDEALLRWVKRIKTNPDLMNRTPAIAAFQFRAGLSAYHGGQVRAGWWMVWHGVKQNIWSSWWSVLWWFSDRVGWTVVEDGIRHGRWCNDHACGVDPDYNCINNSIPKWFKKLTRPE